jgi:uncharacterized RDD family membrane protein YckC
VAREITVVTPENVPLTFELAGLGTRFGAYLVDLLIQVSVTIMALIVFGIVASAGVSASRSIVAAASLVALFLIWFGYFLFFEAVWNGQTPGKKAFGLRVMRDGGYPAEFFAVATRNLIRLADFLPLFYGVGSLALFFSPHYKRLGDMVAGTVVVKEPAARALGSFAAPASSGRPGPVGGGLPEGVADPNVVLTPRELDLLRRFAIRRWEMTPDDSERLAYRLVVPLVPRLGINFVPGAAPRYADLVSALISVADRHASESEDARR